MAVTSPYAPSPALRRVGSTGAAALVVALALAGCSSAGGGSAEGTSSASAADSPSASQSSSTGPSAGVGNSADAAALRSAVTTTTAAGSAKLVIDESVQAAGRTVTVTGGGVTQLGGRGNGQFTFALAGQSIQMRVVDKVIYELLPTSLRGSTPGHKPWIRIDLAKAAGGTGLSVSAPNASQQLGFLKNAQDVSRVGTETVDGVSTVHYRVMTDLNQSLNAVDGASLPASVPVDVWVDGQHRIRVEKVGLTVAVPSGSAGTGSSASAGQSVASGTTIHLSDFGTPVNVVAPPADQTADLTGVVASASPTG